MEFFFLESDIEEIPTHELTINQALEYIRELNIYLIENEESNVYQYELRHEGETIYKSEFQLPVIDFSLYQSIEYQLKKINTKEALLLLNWLKPYFPENQQQAKKTKSNKKIAERQKEETGSYSVFKVIIGLFIVAGIMIFAINMQKTNDNKAESTPTVSQLIAAGDYLAAGEEYPDRIEEIEHAIFESIMENRTDSKIAELREFNEKYPTIFGDFDILVFNNYYRDVTKIYEEYPDEFEKSRERKILAGYSYLKIDQVAEAKEISDQTGAADLKKRIYKYEDIVKQIQQLNEELKNLEKGGSKNRDRAEEIAQQKYDLQEELANI